MQGKESASGYTFVTKWLPNIVWTVLQNESLESLGSLAMAGTELARTNHSERSALGVCQRFRRWLRAFWRLGLRRVTPTRMLAELAIETLVSGLEVGPKVLVAGGGSIGSGSEQVVLSALKCPKPGFRVIFADIDPRCRPTLLADLSSLWPFRDEAFDLCVSTWVLEHLKDPWVFFREAHRVLRDGGLLVVVVPFLHRVHGSPADYWRLTDTALVMLCKQAGFRHTSVHPVGGGPFVATVALLWPLFRMPFVGGLLVLLGFLGDVTLTSLIRAFGKGTPLIRSYPLGYLVCAWKKGA